MEPPFLHKGKKPLKVPAEVILDAVKSIIESGEERSFRRVLKENKATVTISPELINLVKMHLFKKGAHKNNLMARSVVDSDRCD